MKVLFIGAGRRVSLAERFIKAGFDVISYETEINCPIASVATVIEGKKWNDPDIEQHLIQTIQSLNINTIIPLADQATAILSNIINKNPDLKFKIPTSSTKTNNICLNKQLFEQALTKEIYYPNIIQNEDVILKPIFGANSKGIRKVSWDEYKHTDCNNIYVAQRFINSGFEISVDAYFNKTSQMIGAIPRQRLEIQGGEVNRSKTLPNAIFGIVDIVKSIGEKIELIGPVCAQFVIENDKPYIMEINARFGGGVILSLEAGLNIVDLIKQEYVENKEVSLWKNQYKENFYMTRYFKEYYYE